VVDIRFTAATSGGVRPSQNLDDKSDLPERGIFQQLLGLRRLKPYLWPVGNIGFKIRSLMAIFLTVTSKFVIVGSPFFLGHAIIFLRPSHSPLSDLSERLFLPICIGCPFAIIWKNGPEN